MTAAERARHMAGFVLLFVVLPAVVWGAVVWAVLDVMDGAA